MDQLEAPEAGTEFLRLPPPRTSSPIAEAGAFEQARPRPGSVRQEDSGDTYTGLGFWGVLQVDKEVNLGSEPSAHLEKRKL